MKIARTSSFKHPENGTAAFRAWVDQLEGLNGYTYDKQTVSTSLGKTQVYGLHTEKVDRETLVIFPGFRTTSLIWDLDRGLQKLASELRIFLVETNGQPNLSDGNSPDIKSMDYGKWGEEVLDGLGIDKAFIAGASFGGLVCMKIALCIPDRLKGAILLNPGCFRFVSMGFRNLYYNLLPIFWPNEKMLRKFLDAIIFNKPEHQVSSEAEAHLTAYLLLALTGYKDKTQKPYYMKGQLDQVAVDTYLILGRADLLLPYKKTVANAKKHLGKNLKGISIYDAGHGIELHSPAVQRILTIIQSSL